ncbi:class C sortase [Xylanimonas ulmi]|uniref:Sortase A n=1 Tax=Xylanimonas ulmi TaxID=228973 RepID=A0A4Q7M775_9MICO|nr:class C sortase [Xylanibacterium ulmi]RZS61959.1 sortase A [Xylanibacterium ulmi]
MTHDDGDPTGAAPSPSRNTSPQRWRFTWLGLTVALLLQAGLTLLLYPSAASWVAQYNQSNIVFDQAKINAGQAKATIDARIDAAHEYNGLLQSGALYAGGSSLAEGVGVSGADLNYWELLKSPPTNSLARLRIASIDVDLPVYHGTSDDVLVKGLGHLQGTSLPVCGEGTRAVLTGHRGLASATLFTNLDKVEPGDRFTIEVVGRVLTYEVVEIKVIDPDETEEIRPVIGRDLVTLVTCTPLGINTQRILVTGERVLPTPPADVASAGARPEIPGFPWWVIGYGAGTGLAWVWFWRSGRAGRPDLGLVERRELRGGIGPCRDVLQHDA